MEDLVSSLSSSHIGQEAIDLAALHAQLAQTLFSQSVVSSSSASSDPLDTFNQPCNTPTGRTPSSSFSWGQVMDVQQRLSRRNTDDMMDHDAEDERMVEEILIPSSPPSASYSAPFVFQQQLSNASPKPQSRGHHNRFTSPAPSSPNSVADASSSFTSTDPFYLAQLQAMQNQTHTPSSFSQLGRPAQQSPFMQQQPRRESLGFGSSISLDTHNMLAATSVAFER
jgi:hypothetical protein